MRLVNANKLKNLGLKSFVNNRLIDIIKGNRSKHPTKTDEFILLIR